MTASELFEPTNLTQANRARIIGRKIAGARASLNNLLDSSQIITAKVLASDLGITEDEAKKLETGELFPSLPLCRRISGYLGIDMRWLLS